MIQHRSNPIPERPRGSRHATAHFDSAVLRNGKEGFERNCDCVDSSRARQERRRGAPLRRGDAGGREFVAHLAGRDQPSCSQIAPRRCRSRRRRTPQYDEPAVLRHRRAPSARRVDARGARTPRRPGVGLRGVVCRTRRRRVPRKLGGLRSVLVGTFGFCTAIAAVGGAAASTGTRLATKLADREPQPRGVDPT